MRGHLQTFTHLNKNLQRYPSSLPVKSVSNSGTTIYGTLRVLDELLPNGKSFQSLG